jgi:hypothetical protein
MKLVECDIDSVWNIQNVAELVFYPSHEGIRFILSFHRNRWNIDTDDPTCRLFILQAIQYNTDLYGMFSYELPEDIFDRFCSTLSPEYQYVFFLHSNVCNRKVCAPSMFPLLYFEGFYENERRMPGNPTLLPSFTSYSFPSQKELYTFINEINPCYQEGLIWFSEKSFSGMKLMNPTYQYCRTIRGPEQCPEDAYERLQVQNNLEHLYIFKLLYSNV